MKKFNGENILVDDTLKTYLQFKPLHYILSSLDINDDNFKKVDKLISTIENKVKTGDIFLYRVKKEILTNLKHGDYDKTIDNVNNMYNVKLDSKELYLNIVNNFKYSYEIQ